MVQIREALLKEEATLNLLWDQLDLQMLQELREAQSPQALSQVQGKLVLVDHLRTLRARLEDNLR
jgi:hypothetical protein